VVTDGAVNVVVKCPCGFVPPLFAEKVPPFSDDSVTQVKGGSARIKQKEKNKIKRCGQKS